MNAKLIAIEVGASPARSAQGNRRWVFPAPAPQPQTCALPAPPPAARRLA
ncbi:MAG: hypothetical protein V1797_06095 [Pseudomonadota bacterium]